MFQKFTDRARKVMAFANQEAQRFFHDYVSSEHILLGLVKEGSGVGANVLKNFNVDLRKVRLEVEKLVKSGPEMVALGKLPQTPRAKRVIEYAIEEARNLNHNYVGTEHLLLGLLRCPEDIAISVLKNLEVNIEQLETNLRNTIGNNKDEDSKENNSAELKRMLLDEKSIYEEVELHTTNGYLLRSVYDLFRDEIKSLRDAIRKHRDQRGDDRCWLDDQELYKVLPEGIGDADTRLCTPDIMLENCKRFIASRHNPAIPYISPQRQIDGLEDLLRNLINQMTGVIEQAKTAMDENEQDKV